MARKQAPASARPDAESDSSITPPHSEPTNCDDDSLWDDEAWFVIFEPCFSDHPHAANSFANRLCQLIEAIESGPEGTARAVYTLKDGIRLCYRYTEAHQLAFTLYNLYLAGSCRVEDEPLQLLSEAISRSLEKPPTANHLAEERSGSVKKRKRLS